MSESPAETWRARLRSLWWVIPVVAVGFPLLRLLPLGGRFGVDWYNHEWLGAYSGEYLRQHGSLPYVVNTTEQVGMAHTIFYGTVFYPALSLLTTWINPALAMRLVVVLITWLQFHLMVRALVKVEVSSWTARGVACLVIWATYPLTNLYNRSAITEYVATGLLTCAVASWFLLVNERDTARRRRLGLGFGLLFALTAGVHPITALYSMPILVLLLVAAYDEHGRAPAFWTALVKVLALPVVLTIVVLAPWLYVLVSFKRYLYIDTANTDLPWFYAKSLDRWTTRFYPIPHDGRTGHGPLSDLSTPFLDAQCSVPLLILVLGWLVIFVVRNRGAALAGVRSMVFGLSAFAFFTWLSLSPTSYDHLPSFARLIQFAYRHITYQNLSVILAIFMFASMIRRRRGQLVEAGRPFAAILIACLLLSAVSVVIKWNHASAIMRDDDSSSLLTSRSERRSLVTLPPTFYGVPDYTTAALYRPLEADERAAMQEALIPVGTDDEFGLTQPLHLTLANETWIKTNVQAFPWNRIVLDGARVPVNRLRVDTSHMVVHVPDGDHPVDAPDLALLVPAGDHTLELETRPTMTWLVLRAISFSVTGLWLAWFVVASLRVWIRGRRAKLTDAIG